MGSACDEELFSEKNVISEKGRSHSVNEGFGKDLYRKGNSVKRSGPFSEPPLFMHFAPSQSPRSKDNFTELRVKFWISAILI